MNPENRGSVAVKIGRMTVRTVLLACLLLFAGSYEYNFADDDVAPKWTVNFTVKFLLPL